MNFKDCVDFANKNPVAYIATMDGDQPRVRAFLMWFANEEGFYFHTGSPKPICNQLKKNPKVELCFYAPEPPPNIGKMMRVAGRSEFVNDLKLKARLLEERPFLKAMGMNTPDDPMLVVFRIHNGEAYFWTMETNMDPTKAERVKF